tara:strand:+ start:574 stop:714 length:141 start_codon:yes stop_codon:yes gene_type:complete
MTNWLNKPLPKITSLKKKTLVNPPQKQANYVNSSTLKESNKSKSNA